MSKKQFLGTNLNLVDSDLSWRRLFDSISDAVCVIDKDARILYGNKALEKLLKRRMSTIGGKKCYELLHGTRRPPEGCPILRMWKSGKKEMGVILFRGGWIQVTVDPLKNEKGRVTGAVYVIKDITAQKKTENDLRKEREWLERILSITGIGIDIIDADFNLHFVDKNWQKMYGAFSGRKCYEYFNGRSEPCPDCGIPKALKTKKVTVTEERLPRENNRVVEVHTIPFQDATGQWRVAEVNVDITARKKFEDELRRRIEENSVLEEKLRQYVQDLEKRVAQRTEELETFAYSVSHDLRAPLRAMAGFSTALMEDCWNNLGPEGREDAARILDASKRMDVLITDVLAYSRVSREKLNIVPVDLKAAVGEAMSRLEAEIRESGARIKVASKFTVVLGHMNILLQVISNLISNAVKYVKPGSVPEIRVWGEAKGANGVLFVEDKGIGMDNKYFERIFQIFERLHGMDQYPGSGLGLAVVKKGVERMGGCVGVKSAPDKGSLFWIELPLANAR